MATIKLINETQPIGLHKVHKGLQSIIARFQTQSAFCDFSAVIESFTAKEEDGLTPFLILDVLGANIFRYTCNGILSEEMSVIHRQHTEI